MCGLPVLPSELWYLYFHECCIIFKFIFWLFSLARYSTVCTNILNRCVVSELTEQQVVQRHSNFFYDTFALELHLCIFLAVRRMHVDISFHPDYV